MYRIIGIIALAGTLAGCPNPTAPQPITKTFDGEYKIILQSGPFRGPLSIRYGIKRNDDQNSLTINDASRLPWSVKKREPVLTTLGRKHGVTLEVNYRRLSGFTPLTHDTTYLIELWIDNTLKETKMMKIRDSDASAFSILVTTP